MTEGLIILALLAILFALGVRRVRRRLGLSPASWTVLIVGFVIVVLLLWANAHG